MNWKCENLKIWEWGDEENVEMRECGNLKIWEFEDLRIWGFEDVRMWESGDDEIWWSALIFSKDKNILTQSSCK